MAFSRIYLYNQRDQQISLFAQVLGHPARLSIIEKLYNDGPCTVSILHKIHPISQPTLSQHLEILRKAHIVEFKEKFPYTYYSLNLKNFMKAKRLLISYLDKF